ncbi:MAG: M14 family zinc carboxypeptidase [Candidatus Longimicrobiales bacterium M2_2A_002]
MVDQSHRDRAPRPVSTLLSLIVAALIFAAPPVAAQHGLAAGGPYDPAVPTPASVLGYQLGDRFTPHHSISRYAAALAGASPRIRLDTVGHTYEGREVLLAVVTSEANHARLAAIRENAALLADPRGAAQDALDRAVATTPTIAWLGYTIHGNEASGVEAALATLYELAAGQDGATRMVLDSVVVLIDPVQNPDGHERHVQNVMRDRGAFGPDPYPEAMVNTGGWPGARTSHYLFDLNRDWFIHSHPVTRARTGAYLEWAPHVAVDLHEMGSSSTYFFAPPMEPLNPNVEASIPEWWDVFAEGNAGALADRGWGFFTGESFDEFYPGYGVSWPVLTGAIGMTYEQGSSEGGAIRRDDGTILTLREAAAHHYTTSMATLRTVAARRTDRVRDYLEFRQSAVDGQLDAAFRAVVLEPDAQGRAAALVETLLGNAIEVLRLSESAEIRGTPYGETGASRVRVPAGAWVIDLAQPQGRLARAILEPDADLPPAFIEEELQARREGRRDRFYDITAWSLPFTFRVDAWQTGELPDALERVTGETLAGGPVAAPDRARYAYAFAPGSEASYRLLARLLTDSVRVRHAPEAFRIGDADFPGGAFVVLVNRNADRDIHAMVTDAARETGVPVRALDTALADEGTDLGSNSVAAVPVPRVALVGGDGVSAYSFGAAWFAFDQRIRYPATRVELEYLARVLDDFSVVVLPSASSLADALGENGTEALRSWVRDGGVLVTLEESTAWLASSAMTRLAERALEPDEDGERPLPMSVPGAIVRAAVDTLSPLTAGIRETEIPIMLSGDRVYRAPADVGPREVAVRYVEGDRLRLSGYLWPEVPERVAGMPFLWSERLGSGRVIAFAGDPNFRALWRGLLPLFANAVFLGSTF